MTMNGSHSFFFFVRCTGDEGRSIILGYQIFPNALMVREGEEARAR